jgi:hypothetical protein
MIIGQSNKITFKVNVMGTSQEPTVRVILDTSPALTFNAHKLGTEWQADIDLPASTKPGSYDLKVEVMVGNRHFSPLTKKVALDAPEESPSSSSEPEESAQVAAEKEQQLSSAEVDEALFTEPVQEEPRPAVVEPEPAPKPNLMKSIVGGEDLPKKKEPKKITLPKDFFKFEAKKIEPVELPKVIKREPKAKKPKKIIEIKQSTPIRLVKGEVVYK